MKQPEMRQYDIRNVAAFRKTTEKWGELSNMAAGFPIFVNDVHIKNVEALYQSCRYPHLPDVQHKILSQDSPMTAKMVGKPFRLQTRPDWDDVKILIMKWCLRVKLAQNWERFSEVLLKTENMPIVELSNKDDFWGAKKTDENLYTGVNALGRLLMELRTHINQNEQSRFMSVAPLKIDNFKLYNKDIDYVFSKKTHIDTPPQFKMFDV